MDTVKKPNRCSTPVLDLFLGMTLIIRTCHRQRACRMGDGSSSTGTTHQEWLVLICEIMRRPRLSNYLLVPATTVLLLSLKTPNRVSPGLGFAFRFHNGTSRSTTAQDPPVAGVQV